MSRAKRILDRLEYGLDTAVAGMRMQAGIAAGRLWLRDKNQLRGRGCHCPPGLKLHLVHSEALREGCDVVVDFGANIRAAGRPTIAVPELVRIAGQIERGDIIHVKSELIGPFCDHVLPGIAAPFVLVAGDSDYGPVGAFRRLLDDPRLLHWFAQNCDVPDRHPKLTRIPIGFDNPEYNKTEKKIGHAVDMALGKSPVAFSLTRNEIGDQALLQHVAEETRRAVGDKPLRALCTFHMNHKIAPDIKALPDRRDAWDTLQGNPACRFVAQRLPQDECWRIHRDFAFEISPRGNGLDCFRTWESLFLGTIPVVKTSTLDPLYRDEDFPVVIVESWRDVTADNLARWRAELRDKFTPVLVQKLTNGYWLGKIRAAAAPHRDPQRGFVPAA